MSCEHAESTTLLWVYGEAPEAHDSHMAACAECQAVVDGLERVQHALQPIAPTLRLADAPQAPAQVNNGFRSARWGVVLALAASVLFAVGQLFAIPPTVDAPVDTDLAALDVAPPLGDALYGDLDAGLEDLDVDLDSLAWDLNTL